MSNKILHRHIIIKKIKSRIYITLQRNTDTYEQTARVYDGKIKWVNRRQNEEVTPTLTIPASYCKTFVDGVKKLT